jgi:predicted nucleotide-binding protein
MDKSRIFIASSGRTLTLAEKLGDELQTEFCEATLWSEEGRRQPGATIIEMLEKATRTFDFGVIILARDDVMVKETGDTLKARDNCVFEAGLFIKALGRERCFLVNSVEQRDLPSDLGGIISLPFKEPTNLSDRDACAQAIKSVSAALKDSVQRVGRSMTQQRVPLLSVEEVFNRERPHSDGGDLREGRVVVCDLQPMTRPDLCVQVRYNLDHGISYLYFLQNTDDTIEKVIQALQMVLVAGPGGPGNVADFSARVDTVVKESDRVLDGLRRICEMRSLFVALLPEEPQFHFRLHNANDPEMARLYMKFRGDGFMAWAEGNDAAKVWRTLPRFISLNEKRIFVPMKHFNLKGKEKLLFEDSLERALSRYFPGIQDEVKQLCYGTETKTRSR